MVQTQQLPQQPPFQAAQASPIAQQTLREAVTGPAGSHTTAGEPIGTSVLPSRVQANLNSIEEAGVGPMAPLVEDDNSHQSTNSSTDEQDVSLWSSFCLTWFFSPWNGMEIVHDFFLLFQQGGGEETETAPEAEPEDDSITRCICDFLHDDGYMICCDKCL